MACRHRCIKFIFLLVVTMSFTLSFKVWAAVDIATEESRKLNIAVASNFYHTLQILIAESADLSFNANVSSGSTGLLYAQIKNGAPFDVFLSADAARPTLLVQQGLASNKKTFAIGQLVLWPSRVEVETALKTHQGKLVIANPTLAPYGKAAQQVLSFLKLEGVYSKRLILANNVNQGFQFVDSGNAPMAMMALSQLKQAQLIQAQLKQAQLMQAQLLQTERTQLASQNQKYKNFTMIPEAMYSPIHQQLVKISSSKQKEHSQRFIDWLMSEPIQGRLQQLGYKSQNG